MHTQRRMVRMPSRILRGLALLAAALFLAPEAARAQNDACGALNLGNSYTASCENPAYATGIVYWDQENAVTLTVPGSATTTTITTDADNMQDSGIAVRTSVHATEARNIRLTVGGTGTVAIVQGVTEHNDVPVSTFNNMNPNNRGIVVSQQSGNGAITTVDVKSGVTIGASDNKMKSNGLHVEVGGQNAGAVTVTNEAKVYAMWHGVAVSNGGTAKASVTNRGDITADQHGIGVWNRLTAGAVTVTNEAKIDAMQRGVAVVSSGTAAASVTNSGDITAGQDGIAIGNQFLSATALSVTNSGDISSTSTSAFHHGIVAVSLSRGVVDNAGVNAGVSVTHSGGTISVPSGGIGIKANVGLSQQEADSDHPWYVNFRPVNTGLVKVEVKAGSVSSIGDAIEAINYEAGSVEVDISAGVTLTSTQGHGVRAELTDVGNESGWIKITQGGTISERKGVYAERKGVYAEVSRASAMDDAASARPLIDITWTGTFEKTDTVTPNDNARLSVDGIPHAIKKARDVEAGKTIRYGSAAGIEAQAMSWSNIATQVAKGDDPGAFANAAAVAALFNDGADDATKARAAAVIAAFRDALTNPALGTIPDAITGTAAIDAIDTDGMTGLSDDEIKTYLSEDDVTRRILLRDVLAQSLSDKEKAVFQAVVTGAGLDAALDDADADFSDDYKTAVRELLSRYNIGDIRVAMDGGSINSRGDGIRAYYGTPNDKNGAIDVTIAAGASVTGANAGIYVANAGLNEGETGTADAILKQTVTVNGTVTGGTDAAVHLVGGGTLTVGETGVLVAGSGRPAILINDPGRAVIVIHGKVTGSAGARAAVDMTGGGSVTVGPKGRIDADGADVAIRRDGKTTVLTVIQNPDLALENGGFTQESVDDAIKRLGGTVGGDADGEITVAAGEQDDPNRASGVTFPAEFDDGTAVVPDPDKYKTLPRNRENREDRELPPNRMDCDMSSWTTDKCRLYAALPSALLAMNGLPTYGERMAAARDGNGGWARIDGADGEWKAKNSTPSNVAFDYRRYGVQAGVDFAVGGDGRFGVSVRGLQGSAELAGSDGEIDLSGVGAGAHGTAFFGGGFYMDAQAMATWYDVKLTSGGMVLKDGAKGLGLALGVEAGRPIAAGDGLTVTPGAGLSWSEVGLSFTRSMYEVSVEDVRSLVGRAGLRVEMEAGFRLFGSVEATHEFSDRRSARISGERMVSTPLSATEAEKTGFRLGVGGAHGWGDGRYALRGAAGYAARGSGNGEFDGGISLAMRF